MACGATKGPSSCYLPWLISDQLSFFLFFDNHILRLYFFSCVSYVFSPVHFLRWCRLCTSQSFPHHCSFNGVPGSMRVDLRWTGVSVFLRGASDIRSSTILAYDMGDSIRLEMEIRERNYLLHGTVLFVYRCYFFYVLSFSSFPFVLVYSLTFKVYLTSPHLGSSFTKDEDAQHIVCGLLLSNCVVWYTVGTFRVLLMPALAMC